MPREILAWLAPQPGKLLCDGTLGGGGHSLLFAETGAEVLGVDRDPQALAHAGARLARFPLVTIKAGNFRDLPELLPRPVDGLLLDLGVSSAQLDRPERGFSFRAGGPLDMRMGPDAAESLEELLERVGEEELANILYEYGEERRSRPVSRAILRAFHEQKLKSTADLAEVIRRAVGPMGKDTSHPATRSFQALRIALNDELGALESLLQALPEVLAPGGVAAILSYHSLEDRLVKHAFQKHAKGCECPPQIPVCVCGKLPTVEILTKHPQLPSEAEISENPRARSAKLRVCRRRAPSLEEKH
jgi:16S rRNA (cytosine1402-N4)-methyltransferase